MKTRKWGFQEGREKRKWETGSSRVCRPHVFSSEVSTPPQPALVPTPPWPRFLEEPLQAPSSPPTFLHLWLQAADTLQAPEGLMTQIHRYVSAASSQTPPRVPWTPSSLGLRASFLPPGAPPSPRRFWSFLRLPLPLLSTILSHSGHSHPSAGAT